MYPLISTGLMPIQLKKGTNGEESEKETEIYDAP
jgi:hypothetical protein